jgi:hypothetical protein
MIGETVEFTWNPAGSNQRIVGVILQVEDEYMMVDQGDGLYNYYYDQIDFSENYRRNGLSLEQLLEIETNKRKESQSATET